MGIGRIKQNDLDEFVTACDELGGIGSPKCADLLSDFTYEPSTIIDETLSPFSEEYVQEQIKLYTEISGKELDQQVNEFTSFDLKSHIKAQNPYAYMDPTFIAKHGRTVLKVIEIAQLPPSPNVLDMGCGWGLSTEMLAFCAADVTCVDINPKFLELVKQRALKRGHPVSTVHSDFESLELTEQYDMILFYECFHHAVRPWVVIEKMTNLLKPQGKIILAGEPIQSFWWKHWGLRLDSQSVYCIHKFGWFESGWSLSFLQQLFEKNKLMLDCRKGIGFDGGIICIAQNGEETLVEKQNSITGITDRAHNYLRRKWCNSQLSTTPLGRLFMKYYARAKPKASTLKRKFLSLSSSKSK